MELAKVTMPAQGGKVKRGSEWDLEAKRDAERCVGALQQRFLGCDFAADSVQPGTWVVSCGDVAAELTVLAGVTSRQLGVDFKLFAQGFLASRQLWER
jgi:hypothetical protein